jgi:hypothetical protein
MASRRKISVKANIREPEISPVIEAAMCWKICAAGRISVEEMRRLISVSPDDERRLRRTLDAVAYQRTLSRRQQILALFDAMIRVRKAA